MSNKVTVKKTSHQNYAYVVHYPDGGKRKRAFFKKKTGKGGADEWAEKKREELKETGSKEAAITNEERAAVLEWRKIVLGLPEHAQSVSLWDCVKQHEKNLRARNKAISCQLVMDKLLARLLTAGRSKEHRLTLEYRLKPFIAEYGDWLACDVSTEIIDEFLWDSQLRVSPRTVMHYRQAINQLFNHAMDLNAAPFNPVTKAIKVDVKDGEAGIFTPKQVADLLSVANDETLPALAMSFFAGIRRAELERLDWEHVKLDQGYITITAGNAKTSQRRNVKISDNLAAWIKPYNQAAGKVVRTAGGYRKGLETAKQDAKIEKWEHNVGRHSFASYHLAMGEDAGKTARQLGHGNSDLLFQHYHTLVTPEDAKIYWNIHPLESEKVTKLQARS